MTPQDHLDKLAWERLQREADELNLAVLVLQQERDGLKDTVAAYNHEAARRAEREQILHDALADYDRRRASWWGRFLLWVLRETT